VSTGGVGVSVGVTVWAKITAGHILAKKIKLTATKTKTNNFFTYIYISTVFFICKANRKLGS
jgi:hypothetical protein